MADTREQRRAARAGQQAHDAARREALRCSGCGKPNATLGVRTPGAVLVLCTWCGRREERERLRGTVEGALLEVP